MPFTHFSPVARSYRGFLRRVAEALATKPVANPRLAQRFHIRSSGGLFRGTLLTVATGILLTAVSYAGIILEENSDRLWRMARLIPVALVGGARTEGRIPAGRNGSEDGFLRASGKLFHFPDLGAVADTFGSATCKDFHLTETVVDE